LSALLLAKARPRRFATCPTIRETIDRPFQVGQVKAP